VSPIARRLLALTAIAAVGAGACSGGNATPTPTRTAAPTPAPVTASPAPNAVNIEWWHSSTADPGKSVWQAAASLYMDEHPWVSITVEPMSAETLEARLASAQSTGLTPDLFESTGGVRFISQARAGVLEDITSQVAAWTDPSPQEIAGMNVFSYQGKQYGAPWAMGMAGFFYNQPLFTKAGIANTPTSWSELLADIDKLKAASIVPFAIAGKDEWPGMNLWTYLLLREAGSSALTDMILNGSWGSEGCVRAGTDLAALVAKNPFQPGYMSAVYDRDEAAWMGNGKAAMELMGEWGPAVAASSSTSGTGIGSDVGWFPFPAVAGGTGDATDGLGSATGIAVGKNAPPEALDFLHFLMSTRVMDQIGHAGMGFPTAFGSVDSIDDQTLHLIVSARNQARSMQLYLDRVSSPALTQTIEDNTAALLGGRATAQQVCQAIAAAAKPS
jgi:raffinose/stachyose/melibiose transport system substrate-binding protein